MALTTYDGSGGTDYEELLKRIGLPAPVAPWQTIDYDAAYKALTSAQPTTPAPISSTVVSASALASAPMPAITPQAGLPQSSQAYADTRAKMFADMEANAARINAARAATQTPPLPSIPTTAPLPSDMETMPTYTRTSAPVTQPVAGMFDGLGLPTLINPIFNGFPSPSPTPAPNLGDSPLLNPGTNSPGPFIGPPIPAPPQVTYGDKKEPELPFVGPPLPTYTAPLPDGDPSEMEKMPTRTRTTPVAESPPPVQSIPQAEAKPPARAPLPAPDIPLAPWQKIDYDAAYKALPSLPTSGLPTPGDPVAKANADALFREVMPEAAKAKEQIQAGDVVGGANALSNTYKIPLPQAQENATAVSQARAPVTVEAPVTPVLTQPDAKVEAPVTATTTTDTGVKGPPVTGQADTPTPTGPTGPGDKKDAAYPGINNGTVVGPGDKKTPPPPAPPTPSTPGNQGSAQAGITTPPPIAPLPSATFKAPTPSAPRDRLDLPTPPTIIPTPLADTLAKNPAVPVTDRRALPDLPSFKPGNFQEYLAANSTGGQTPEQLAAEAKRLRELQTNPLLSQITSDRAAAQKRNELALSQVGQGKEDALYGLDQGFKDNLARIQALAIRNGLTASNIPLEQDIRPLANDYNIKRRGIEESIANKITQLQLEAQLGDRDAARRLADIQSSAGTLEASKLFDLTQAERSFGEQSRQNRLGEFATTQNLDREASQTDFANRLGLVNTTEQQRQADIGQNQQNRQQSLNEYLGVNNLRREASMGDFANRLGLVNVAESQRQADIAQGQQGRQQSFAEFMGQQNLDLEGKRLQDALSNSGLDRRMTAAQLEDYLKNGGLRDRLTESQINANNAGASRGGMSIGDVLDASDSARQGVLQVRKMLADKAITEQEAQALYRSYREPYDKANGAGAFDRDFGGFVAGAQSSGVESPNTYGADTYNTLRAQAQNDVSNLENQIAQTQKEIDAGMYGSVQIKQLGNAIAAQRQQIDAIKKKWGL